MSETRRYSRALAVALNYNIPNLSGEGITALRAISTFTAPTVYNGFTFANLSPTRNGGFSTFSIYGISVYVRDASDEDILFKLYSEYNDEQVDSIQFTLPANQTSVKYNDGVTEPIISGLDPAQTYYIHCEQPTPPVNKAQGIELSYYLHRI